MIHLRWDDACRPRYMTPGSVGADLTARISHELAPGQTAAVPTGVWIERVDWDAIPPGLIPELQVRARSGLALKKSIMLANGVGTVDWDYPDEICALLFNAGSSPFQINEGDRIAQLVLTYAGRMPNLGHGSEESRVGGLGSTGV